MAIDKKRLLVRIPELELAESPSSWFSRAALWQGVTVKELLRVLRVEPNTDLDLSFARERHDAIAAACGISGGRFALSKRMFGGVRELDAHGTRYLLSYRGTPRYRFCAGCLYEQRENYFPLHWRFIAWRWCPLHDCMLDDVCPRCASMVLLPANMLMGGAKREGVGSLGRCMTCSEKLFGRHEETTGTLDFSLLSSWECVLLKNGRALLAALHHRKVRLEGGGESFSLAAIRRMEREGMLPHKYFKLDMAEILRRWKDYSSVQSVEATG